MDTQARFIPALSGLRFLAALCVLIGHLSGWTIPVRATPVAVEYFAQNLTIIGMPLFFVLSGFIMQHVYGSAFSKRFGWAEVRAFSIARFSRLYPLYAAFILIQLSFAVPSVFERTFTEPLYLRAFLAAMSMSQTWSPWTIGDVPVHEIYWGINWSISTEVFFYLVFPVLALGAARITNARTAAVVVLAAVVASYAYQFAIFHYVGNVRWLAYYSPYGRLPEFVTGLLTCRLFQTSSPSSAREERWGRLATYGFATIIIALWLTFGSIAAAHREPGAAFFVYLHQNYMMGPFVAGLIYCAARYRSSIQQLFATRPLVHLGELSYSIYLSHPFVPSMLHASMIYAALSWTAAAHYALILLCGITLTIILSSGLYSLVEVPSRRFIRAMARGREATSPVAYDGRSRP